MTRTLLLVLFAAVPAFAQQPAPPPNLKMPPTFNAPATTMPAPAAVEKTGESTYRIGEMQLDTKKKELVVPGTVNDVAVLEFIANTLGGFKAYESALTLNTNAVSFNAALLVLGVDPSRSRAPEFQFDPKPPQGDPVEISVSWNDGRRARTVPIEELIYDQRSKTTLRKGPWVYTGSTLIKNENGPMFLAEMDGVLIGFMHGPQAVIDNPRDDARNGFGMIVLNPNLGLKPGMAITVTVKVLPLK
jgi:hypothetical protein